MLGSFAIATTDVADAIDRGTKVAGTFHFGNEMEHSEHVCILRVEACEDGMRAECGCAARSGHSEASAELRNA